MDRLQHTRATALAVALCVAQPVRAAGQAPPEQQTSGAVAPETPGGGDIIVTARRREEALQSVPIAITAYNQRALERRSVRDIADLSTIIPALIMQGAAGRRDTPSIGIRGQRTQDTLLSADPSVAFYFDDVILSPNQGINLSLYDMNSVQVLKGPQGTLFGRNTTGGAVLFTPNQPTGEFGAGITGRYGNYDEVGVTGYVNVPVTPQLKLRVAGNFLKHNGYAKVVAGSQAGHELENANQRSIRAIAAWDPSPAFSNTTTFAYDRSRSGGAGLVLTAIDPATFLRYYNGSYFPSIFDALARQQGRSVRELEANGANFERTNATLVINTSVLRLGDVQLKNIFGYRRLKYGLGYDADDSPISILTVNNPTTFKQFTDELQLSGTAFADKTNWIAGFYFFNGKGSDVNSGDAYAGLNPNSPIVGAGTVNNRSLSGYIQQTTKLTPKLSLTTGVRYTVDRRRGRPVSYTLPTAPNPNVCGITDANGNALPFDPSKPYNGCYVDLHKTFSRPTWTISLDYQLQPHTLIYLASRRGYRTGGFNVRGLTPAQQVPFRPETVTDLEGGLKTDAHPLGWTVRANLAAYVQKYKKIQRNVTFIIPQTGVVTSSIVNAARATIWGGEAELTILPTRDFQLDLGYSYVHAAYDRFVTADGDFSDRKFAGIPKNQFNANASYTFERSDRVGELTLTGTYIYRSGFYNNELYQNGAQVRDQAPGIDPALASLIPDHPFGMHIPKLGLFNARLAWDKVMGTRFGAALYCKNLANKTYRDSGLSLYESLGAIVNTYGPPRTYGVEVSVEF